MRLFGSGGSPTTDKALPSSQGDGSAQDVRRPDALLPEMSFLDHLEELRWRIFKGLGGVVLGSVICAYYADFVIDQILLGPTHAEFFMYRIFGFEATELVLQNRTITGQFFAYWGSVVFVGAVIGSPIFLYQAWKFLEPGLYPTERKGMRFASFFATMFFILGILFGYCIVTPMALQFFANFVISPQIVNEFDIIKYFSMVSMWVFGIGVLFELPIVMYFLSKIGLVTAAFLRKGRKYALIIILIIAALITPPDVVSQILTAIPLLGLYELSIYISVVVERNRERELQKALS
ncbi:MAG: twin-arginine translocase subunit TatC [Rhodothermales bacterium]